MEVKYSRGDEVSMTLPLMFDGNKKQKIESGGKQEETILDESKTFFNGLNALSEAWFRRPLVKNFESKSESSLISKKEMDRSIEQKPKTVVENNTHDQSQNDHHDGLASSLWVLAEIIATFLLVFVTCGAAALSESDERRVPKLGASLAGGLIVTVMIYSVGHISGAHMNPAVTLAFAAVRHFPWKQVPLYAAAQLTGAILGALTLRQVLHPIQHIGTTTPSGADVQALIMEIVVTFIMMFVTSAVATDTKAVGELAGIAVGSAVCITSIFAGPISGGSMNPVRTLGPAIASGCYKGLWVYIVGPVTGTLLGSCAYRIIRENDKAIPAMFPSNSFKLPSKMNNHGHHVDRIDSIDF